jgi:cyclophilin family peptidyl-prolyl cis-trans isomerase/HEAT repeat protein
LSASLRWGPGIALVIAAATLSARADQAARNRNVVFTCGEDIKLQEPIPLTWGNVVLAGDARQYVACNEARDAFFTAAHPPDHIEIREAVLINQALVAAIGVGGRAQPTPLMPRALDLRWRAVQAFARLGGGLGELQRTGVIQVVCNARALVFDQPDGSYRWQPGRLFALARDRDPMIRREAAYAIGVQLAAAGPRLPENLIGAAAEEMRVCAMSERDASVAGVWLDALGAVRNQTFEQIAPTEDFLVEQSRDASTQARPKVYGAIKGLEALTRLNPKYPFKEATKVRLREVVHGPLRSLQAGVRVLAFMALRSARAIDDATLRAAAVDTDWQVRRLAAMSLSLADATHAQIADPLERDLEFQVRYEMLPPLQRQANLTGLCEPIFKYFRDPSPIVVMRAMDALVPSCSDLDEAHTFLLAEAERLARPDSHVAWHLPSRALNALARIDPGEAAKLMESAVRHPVWEVRAAAAATSVTLGDAASALALARDREPNVRTAALDALFRLESGELFDAALSALQTGDFQLLRAAALQLRPASDEQRVEATTALLAALRRLTGGQSDTSRDTRVAMLEKLAETMPPERSSDLLEWIVDFDDEVIAAARAAFTKLVGAPPGDPPKKRRYPFQPAEAELYDLPEQARIGFKEGSVVIAFNREVAPVTVARVRALIQQGYYNGKTFHRVVPNFVVQGGSPGRNEYVGVPRFMRDEVGPQASHVRGAVGISTRGRDTGDAQIFIDLVDLPRLDRDYTVFARVIEGMEIVDRLLEGAVIQSISIIK